MSTTAHSKRSTAASIASLPETQRRAILNGLTSAQLTDLAYDWRFWARPGQLPPGTPGAESDRTDWIHWLPLAGRGWGKTRVGAEFVRLRSRDGSRNFNIVGPTASAVRAVMIEGPSGLLSCFHPDERPRWEPSRRKITFQSGAIAETFSADEPERLRGPQCTDYWGDEPCAWRFLADAWDNLMFGFRLGDDPRGIITTTPKPSQWLREMMAAPETVVTRHATHENRANLAPAFLKQIITKYEGTRLGRQELLAEVLDDTPGALWTLRLIDMHRWKNRTVPMDELVRVVVAVDPAVSTSEDSADTGIVVAGLLRNGHILVIEDLTCHDTPLAWAQAARAAFKKWRCDRVIGEVNNGGDLVERNLQALDPNVPFLSVRATRGKARRAEPVAAMYEQGRVHHVGSFPELESQMTTFVPGSDQNGRLDRMDALVWAITGLTLDVEEQTTTASVLSRVVISRY